MRAVPPRAGGDAVTPPRPAAARDADLDAKEVVVAARTVILVGNPNVGKSVLFGALTGKYVTVSNYPGTTVEVTRGSATIDGHPWHVMDTPGTNNLLPMSEDEQVTRDILLVGRGYVALPVCDAKNLQIGRPPVARDGHAGDEQPAPDVRGRAGDARHPARGARLRRAPGLRREEPSDRKATRGT